MRFPARACATSAVLLLAAPALAQSGGTASSSKPANDSKTQSKEYTCANPARTLTFDVIDLVAGREVAGTPEHSVDHEGITYWFATAEHRSQFTKDPRAHEVADEGACGRMGPLSGLGDARRFHVHEGRVYFFASDGCREGFRKNPAACIERADPRPTGTPEARADGAAAMDAMVAWAGGAEVLRDMRTYREVTEKDRPSGARVYKWSQSGAAHFPTRYVMRESWDDSWFSTIRSEKGTAMASASRGTEPVGPARAEAFDRVLGRRPLVILKAWVDQKSARPGETAVVEAFAAGEAEVDGARVVLVQVWMNGALSTFAVDPVTGRPVEQRFLGREGPTSIGEVRRRFTAEKIFYGVRLPTAWSVTFNGKPQPEMGVEIDRFEINPALGDELFSVRAVPPQAHSSAP